MEEVRVSCRERSLLWLVIQLMNKSIAAWALAPGTCAACWKLLCFEQLAIRDA